MIGKIISVNSQILRWNEELKRWYLSELEIDNNSVDIFNPEEGILETYKLNEILIEQDEKSQKKIKLKIKEEKNEILKFLNSPDKEILINFYDKLMGNNLPSEPIEEFKREKNNLRELSNEEIEEIKKKKYYLKIYLNLKNNNSI